MCLNASAHPFPLVLLFSLHVHKQCSKHVPGSLATLKVLEHTGTLSSPSSIWLGLVHAIAVKLLSGAFRGMTDSLAAKFVKRSKRDNQLTGRQTGVRVCLESPRYWWVCNNGWPRLRQRATPEATLQATYAVK